MQGQVRLRGSWQLQIARNLLSGDAMCNPLRSLRGAARRYSGRYARSFAAVLAAIEAAGYTVVRTPGPRGGEWSATYRVEVKL